MSLWRSLDVMSSFAKEETSRLCDLQDCNSYEFKEYHPKDSCETNTNKDISTDFRFLHVLKITRILINVAMSLRAISLETASINASLHELMIQWSQKYMTLDISCILFTDEARSDS